MKLTTANLLMEFSEVNGALTHLESTLTGWVIHRRPELGLSWELNVPENPAQRNCPVYGEKQRLSAWEQGEDYVKLFWKNVESERSGRLAIDVTVTVRREGDNAVWLTEVDNRSPYTVECVTSPSVGDLTAPDKDGSFTALSPEYAAAYEWSIYPVFHNNRGDWGIENPIHITENVNPYGHYILMHDGKQGLYAGIGAYDCECMAWKYELRPGYDCHMYSTVPKEDEIDGQPVHIRFGAVHMCYLASGEKRALTPVLLSSYTGSWQKGVDIYKKWRGSNTAALPDWVKQPHSWLQIQMNSPTDEYRYKYADLPRIAAECAENGIRAIQLVGWNRGGQDQGNPYHDTDPRLGTFEELKEAIRKCRALGVKIILFTKFTWGDRDWPGFKEEIEPHTVRDPFGHYNANGGYQYYTMAQYLGISSKRLVPMCFGSQKYLDIVKREFLKELALEPDGILYDECQHHNGQQLCFATSHGHRAGWPIFKNDLKLIQMLKQMQNVPADFLFAGEACYDRELQEYQMAYFRSRDPRHKAIARYERPDAPLMTAITSFHERNMINQCLMNRYIISYEPGYFKGLPTDIPDTLAYGRKMDDLRTRERKYLWDGEYRDAQEAQVTKENGEIHESWSCFKAKDGTNAYVLCNFTEKPVTLTLTPDEGTLSQYTTVDEEAWHPFTGTVTLQARSAAVVK